MVKLGQRDHQDVRAETQSIIGRICILWSYIDMLLDKILEVSLDLSEANTLAVAQSVGRVPAKCELIQKLLLSTKISDVQTAKLSGTLAYIIAHLGPDRNRYVHDLWDFSVAPIVRVDRRVKTGKPQSRQKNTLVYNLKSETSLQELSDWCIEATTAGLNLRDFWLAHYPRNKPQNSPKSQSPTS
jgi:hypothetical protein